MTVQEGATDGPAIIFEHFDSYALIQLNQQGRRNALSKQTLQQLDKFITAVTGRDDVNAIILTGVGDVFASGADINELATLTQSTAKDFAQIGQSVFAKIANAKQKTIAAINGYCAGGGLDLALSCDLRCASANAVFSHPGGRLGIITGWGGTQRLPRLIGTARAFEMFTTARRVTSREALEIGLIHRIGDPVLSFALELLK